LLLWSRRAGPRRVQPENRERRPGTTPVVGTHARVTQFAHDSACVLTVGGVGPILGSVIARRRWQRSVLVLAVVPVIAACGSPAAEGPLAQGSQSTPPTGARDGDVQVGCGGTAGWSPSVMSAGLPGVLTKRQVEDAFTDLLAHPKYRGELASSFLEDGPTRTPWRVLRVDGDTYTLGLGRWTKTGPQGGATVFEMRGHPGSWAWSGGGDCRLAPVLTAGDDWVRLTVPRQGLDRQSRHPAVGVTEQECASGRDPRPFLRAPTLKETSTAVTVYWTAAAPAGNASCVGRAPVNVSLPLAAPLHHRKLLDGSTFPPTPVR
jgi:hypothetical protein